MNEFDHPLGIGAQMRRGAPKDRRVSKIVSRDLDSICAVAEAARHSVVIQFAEEGDAFAKVARVLVVRHPALRSGAPRAAKEEHGRAKSESGCGGYLKSGHS